MNAAVQTADVLRYANVGVVLAGRNRRPRIEGISSRKLMVVDKSVYPKPEIGSFVVVTEIAGETEPGNPNKGVYFCKCRPLAAEEVKPEIFGSEGELRLWKDPYQDPYRIRAFAKLLEVDGDGDKLSARIELSYLLWYQDPDMPWIGGRAVGTWIEERRLPLITDKSNRETSEPRYFLWRNYHHDHERYPLYISSSRIKESWDNQIWDWNFIQVPTEASGEALKSALELL